MRQAAPGELDGALIELLRFCGDAKTVLPRELLRRVDGWIFGYTGTPAETQLRELLNRIPAKPDNGRMPRSAGAAVGGW